MYWEQHHFGVGEYSQHCAATAATIAAVIVGACCINMRFNSRAKAAQNTREKNSRISRRAPAAAGRGVVKWSLLLAT